MNDKYRRRTRNPCQLHQIFITQKYKKKTQTERDAYQKKRHIQNNN